MNIAAWDIRMPIWIPFEKFVIDDLWNWFRYIKYGKVETRFRIIGTKFNHSGLFCVEFPISQPENNSTSFTSPATRNLIATWYYLMHKIEYWFLKSHQVLSIFHFIYIYIGYSRVSMKHVKWDRDILRQILFHM